ncbi:MAG: hypothetical protein JW909_02775 [Planctomycetes bacterium]|nr:hypothetical protein [Planctomycetota bacterium]
MRRSEKGSAILLVIFVLAVILAIAIPLIYYVQLDYRRASMAEARVRARLAAEGAIDHALAYAMLGAEGAERSEGALSPYNTPEYDSYEEFGLDFSLGLYPELAQAYLSQISFANPAGLIWHGEIEDEQGKININSAPPPLMGNLLGSATLAEPLRSEDVTMYVDTALFFNGDDDLDTVDGRLRVSWEELSYTGVTEETVEGLMRNENDIDETTHRKGTLVYDARAYDAAQAVCQGDGFLPYASTVEVSRYIGYYGWRRIADCITIHSSTEGATGWQRSEPVVHAGLESDAKGLRLKDINGFGIGTLVRVLVNGEPILAGRVAWLRSRGANSMIWLDREIGVEVLEDDGVTVEARLPHPVNINTAHRRTLAAVFKGVGLMGTNEVVDVTEAEALAELATQRVFSGPEAFKAFLDEAVAAQLISGNDRTALYKNATVPNCSDLRLVTVPFTYRSYGDVTLVGRGIANDGQGRVLGRHHERMIVSIPAEEDGEWGLSSQEDFEKQRAASNAPLVVTWPESVKAGKSPDERGYDVENDEDPYGDVRLMAADDERPLRNSMLKERFEKEQGYPVNPDGADLTKGGSPAYPAQSGFRRGSKGTVEPGYFGIWAKCPSWSGRRRYLFSLGTNLNSDRISFYYDGRAQELVGEVAGPDMEPRHAKFRMRFSPADGDWYHLAMRYAGDRPGEVAFFVDGRVPGPGSVTYWIGDDPVGKLASGVTDSTTSIQLDNDAFLKSAQRGVVQINGEVIEFNSRSGKVLSDLRRGARYTVAESHDAGDYVIPFGYSNPISGNLPRGGAVVVGDAGASPTSTLADDVDAAATSIDLNSTDGFQESGYVRVGGEYIYYGSLSGTTLSECKRGEWGTSARAHPKGRPLRVYSLQVSARSDYRTSEYVSIEDQSGKVEWVYLGRILQNGDKVFFCPSLDRFNNPGTFRGALGTAPIAHKDQEKAVPVMKLSGPQCGNWDPVYKETVTLIENEHKETMRLNRAYSRYGPNKDASGNIIGWWHTYYASTDNFPTKAIAGGARLVKFPSGEMPLGAGGRFYVAAERQGSSELQGYVDELRMCGGLSCTGILPPEADVAANEALINVLPDYVAWSGTLPNMDPPPSGLMRIGSEYIYYRTRASSSYPVKWGSEAQYDKKRDTRNIANAYQMQGCLRGVLGSSATGHGPGERVEFYDEYAISILAGALSAESDSISVLDAQIFPAAGYLMVGSEVIGWTSKSGNSLEGCEKLHGRFGTPAGGHGDGSICIPIPFRYHSRYIKEYDGEELAYFGAARAIRGAVWQTLSYKVANAEGGSSASDDMQLRLALNPDRKAGWDEKAANKPDGLLVFTRDGNHQLPRIRADEVILRAYFEYLPGAFNGNGWKRTLRLENVFLGYSTPLVVRRNDVIEK